jgi:antitoxin HigA-1
MVPSRRKPTHPGVVLLEEFLKPLNLTAKQFAEKLGGSWSEIEITAIIKGKEGITEKTARDFADALGTTAAFWTRMDQQYYQHEQVLRQNEKGKTWKKAE